MMGFGFSQDLPKPVVVGEDLDWPTLKVSQFVKTDESIFVKNNGMGVLKKKIKFRKDKGLFFVHHFVLYIFFLFSN